MRQCSMHIFNPHHLQNVYDWFLLIEPNLWLNEDQTQNLKVNTNIDTIRKYFSSLVNSLVTPKMLFLTHVIKFRNRFSFRWEMIPLLNNKLCNKILDKIICIQRNIQFIAEFWCRNTERKTNEFWFLVQFWPTLAQYI